jgi:hypothetical protein
MFKKMIAKVREDYSYWCWCESCLAEYERKPAPKTTPMRYAVAFMRYFMWSFIPHCVWGTICKIKGHDWHEDGYCGPDSGAIDMECKRCGESHHHQLY